MSHVCDIKTEIKDLEALAEAAKELGLELVRDQRTFKWYGRHVGDYPLPAGFTVADMGKCDHAIRIPGNSGAYEIGVVKRRDGKPGYTLLYDFWAGGRGMSAKCGGDQLPKLVQEYTAAAVKRSVRHTHRVQRTVLPNGTVKLILTKA